jgi:ketosteroid isomerase-like protein
MSTPRSRNPFMRAHAPSACAMTVTTLALPVTAGAQDAAARASDAQVIRAHIESIFQAFVDKDLKKLEATRGERWRGLSPGSGRVICDLEGHMRPLAGLAAMPKDQGLTGYRISDFDVVFHGDTAIAAFAADLELKFGPEKRTQKLTLMDVYHKEPAGWIQVASDTALHPEEIDAQMSRLRTLSESERTSLLAAREAAWRAWFAGDADALGKLVPPELVTIEPDSDAFGTHASTVAASRGFAASGGKLTRLVFPRTEFQAYGNTVIIYTLYEMDITTGGGTRTDRGAATEIFVRQNDRWINTGWQLAPIAHKP